MVEYHEEIKRLEDEMRKTQYNKATERHFGVIKAKIARLRESIEKRQASKKGGEGFFVKKSGDATVVLLGFPSVGKSTLLNKITNAQSEVAAYEFTTLTVIPGIMEYNKAKIQILDVPGILSGAASGRGRGKEVLAIVRSCNLILIIIDALHPEHYSAILKEVFDVGVRINQRKPDVKIVRKSRGGLSINTTVKLALDKTTVEDVMKEFKLNNADVVIRTKIDLDQLIDCIEGNRSYTPAVIVVSKADLVTQERLNEIKKQIKPDLFISAETDQNIEALKELIFTGLSFVRIYLKEVNKKADMQEPMILKKGATIKTVCEHLHKDFVRKFRFVKIWGKSAKFPGQVFRTLDKELIDGDVVEMHLS